MLPSVPMSKTVVDKTPVLERQPTTCDSGATEEEPYIFAFVPIF